MPNKTGRPTTADPHTRAMGGPFAPPVDPVRKGYKGSPINNTLFWLINAFGLQSQSIPIEVNAESVVPTVDVLQGGWATAVYSQSTRSSDTGAATPRPQLWLVAPDVINTQVVVAVSIILAGTTTVTPNRCLLYLAQGDIVPPTATNDFKTWTTTNGTFAQINSFLLASDATVSDQLEGTGLVAITGGSQNVLIAPPGFGLAMQMFDPLTAGQFIKVFMVAGVINGQAGVR